jgi:hypothetical protein
MEAISFILGMPLIGHVAAALAVWLTAAGLSLFPRRRLLAKSLALAMAGTFPGVLVFQILAAPICALALIAYRVSPRSSAFDAVWMAGVWGSILLATLLGFRVGWRIGWRFGQGVQLRIALGTDPVVGRVAIKVSRRWPALGRLLGAPER